MAGDAGGAGAAVTVLSVADAQLRTRRALLALCIALVVHASLYPWLFAAPPSWELALRQMFVQRLWWTGRGDAIANVLLFLPIGAAGWLVLDPGAFTPRQRWLRVLPAAAALAFVLQLLQLALPERTAAVSDALWNVVGTLLGVPLAAPLRAPLDRLAALRLSRHRTVLTIAVLWLAVEGWPWMPSHNLRHAAIALQPLWRPADWSVYTIIGNALGLAAVMLLCRDLRRRWRFMFVLLACAVVAKLLMRNTQLTPSHLAGWLLGLGFGAATWRSSARFAALALLAMAVAWLVVSSLHPFDWGAAPSTFHWIPLWESLQSARVARTLALLQTLFWTGVAMAAAERAFGSSARVAVALTLLLAVIELAQRWLPGRLAESTPLLFPLAWWWLWQRWRAPAERLHL